MTDDEPDIVITTPQFDREDDFDPADPPLTDGEFGALREMSEPELKELGLRRWDDSGLMLLPAEWYPHIPEGVEIVGINGETEEFSRDTHSDDRRFGCLAYGIIPEE